MITVEHMLRTDHIAVVYLPFTTRDAPANMVDKVGCTGTINSPESKLVQITKSHHNQRNLLLGLLAHLDRESLSTAECLLVHPTISAVTRRNCFHQRCLGREGNASLIDRKVAAIALHVRLGAHVNVAGFVPRAALASSSSNGPSR